MIRLSDLDLWLASYVLRTVDANKFAPEMTVIRTPLIGLLKTKHFRTTNFILTYVYYYDTTSQGSY
jgi:hypothetical protein